MVLTQSQKKGREKKDNEQRFDDGEKLRLESEHIYQEEQIEEEYKTRKQDRWGEPAQNCRGESRRVRRLDGLCEGE